MKKNNILVTGAAGSIGKALCNKIKQIKTGTVIALDKSEIGIYNLKREFINNKSNLYWVTSTIVLYFNF